MMLVVIESPFSPSRRYNIEENIEFAVSVCRWAVKDRGVAPYASHLFFPNGVLDEFDPFERNLGIEAGLVWSAKADEAWFCLRSGEALSSGMRSALERFVYLGIPMRKLTFHPTDYRLISEEELSTDDLS